MAVTVSEHILLLDENILAVSLFSNQLHLVETASRDNFDKRFKIEPSVQDSSSSYASVVYGTARLLQPTFGQVEKITVDHEDVKLVLLVLKDHSGFVGLVLTKTVNADYLALKILRTVENIPKEALT